ncbi:MAG: hypothetical protein VW270_28900 [Candidatus Poseidoniales archaeon]
MANTYLTEIFAEFKALNTVAEKIAYLENLKKTGAVDGYDIKLDNTIKSWAKQLDS